MEPLAILAILLFIAFLVETLTEAVFSPIFERVPALTPFKWALMYVALVIGVVGAFLYKFDVIYLLGLYLKQPIVITWYGILLTGLAIGKGSNYLHELIRRFLTPKPGPQA